MASSNLVWLAARGELVKVQVQDITPADRAIGDAEARLNEPENGPSFKMGGLSRCAQNAFYMIQGMIRHRQLDWKIVAGFGLVPPHIHPNPVWHLWVRRGSQHFDPSWPIWKDYWWDPSVVDYYALRENISLPQSVSSHDFHRDIKMQLESQAESWKLVLSG